MSSIGPVTPQPPAGPTPPPVGQLPPSPTPVDTFARVNVIQDDTRDIADLDMGTDTLMGYLKTIGFATLDHQEFLREAERRDLQASLDFFKALSSSFSEVASLYNEFELKLETGKKGAPQLDPLTDAVNTASANLETAVTDLQNYESTYETALAAYQGAVNALNAKIPNNVTDQDINNYNAALADYQAANTIYNSHRTSVSGAKSTYNAAVAAYNVEIQNQNDLIELENDDRIAAGLEPIPLKEELPNSSYDIPPARSTPSSLPLNPKPTSDLADPPDLTEADDVEVGQIIRPSDLQLDNLYTPEFIQKRDELQAVVGDNVDITFYLQEFEVELRLPGQSITLPEASRVLRPEVEILSEGSGGAGMASQVIGLDNSNAESIVGNSLVGEILKDFNLGFSPELVGQLRDLAILGTIQTTQRSFLQTAAILGGNVAGGSDSALRAAQALGVNNRVLSLIKGGGLSSSIQELAQRIPGAESLSKQQLQRLVNNLTGIAAVAFLNQSSGLLFNELGHNALFNVQSVALLLGGGPGASKRLEGLSGALKKQVSLYGGDAVQAALGEFLAGRLEVQGIDSTTASTIADFIARRFADDADFKASLKELKRLIAQLLSGFKEVQNDISVDTVTRDVLSFVGAADLRSALSSLDIQQKLGGKDIAPDLRDKIVQAEFGFSPNISSGKIIQDLRTDGTSLLSLYEDSARLIKREDEERLDQNRADIFADDRKDVTEVGEYYTKLLDNGVAITKHLSPFLMGARGAIDRKHPTDIPT